MDAHRRGAYAVVAQASFLLAGLFLLLPWILEPAWVAVARAWNMPLQGSAETGTALLFLDLTFVVAFAATGVWAAAMARRPPT